MHFLGATITILHICFHRGKKKTVPIIQTTISSIQDLPSTFNKREREREGERIFENI